MANTQLTISSIAALRSSQLPKEWQRAILDSDFTDCQPLPHDLEDEYQQSSYHLDHLKTLKQALQPWADGKDSESGEGFWTSLVENDVCHKALLCMLFYIMDIGEKRVANAGQREAGISAADVYFTLVMVPGSGAFKIFHPVLYQKATDLFKTWKQLGCPKRKRSSFGQPSQSQCSQRSKSRKKVRNTQPVEEKEDSDSEEDEVCGMTPHEVTKLNKALFKLLKSFVKLLKSYPLREAEDAAYNSLQMLADLAKMEPETFSGEIDDDKQIDAMKTVPELVYRGLDLITTKAHGDEATMTNNVMKHLLPVLLMYLDENKAVAATNIPRSVQISKDHAVSFVCHMIKKKQNHQLVSVRTLLQHMSVHVPDKAEYRTKVAEAVVTILKAFPAEAYAKFIQWIFKLSKHTKMSSRGFALDLTCLLMEGEERSQEPVEAELSAFVTHSFLLQLILARCSDIAPTVRARAITHFSAAMSSLQPNVAKAIQDMMTPVVGVAGGPNRPPESRVNPTPLAERTQAIADRDKPTFTPMSSLHISGERSSIESATGLQSSRQSLENALVNVQKAVTTGQPSPLLTVQLTPGVEITLTDGQGVTSMLRRRMCDEKVNVRKAALLALESLIRMNKDNVNEQDLSILSERCRDPALSVRKQAMQSLTDLLYDIPRNKLMQKYFLSGVLPMVLDRESTAMEKCMDILCDVILGNIVQYDRSMDDCHRMVWELLNQLAGIDGVDLRRYLSKACKHWGKSGKLKSGLISSLKTHINTENNSGVWLLLSEVAFSAPKFNTVFVLDYWNDHARSAPSTEFSTVQRVLAVLQHVADNIDKDKISGITADLKQRLMKFDLPTEIISATVSTLHKLCRALTGDKDVADRMTKEWFEDLLKACDVYLSGVILNQTPDDPINEDQVICYLFTLGEICQLCPDKVSKRACMLVQSLITTPVITSTDGSSQQSSHDSAKQDSIEATNVSSENSVPTSQLSQGQSQASQPLSQFRGGNMSKRIRAHAFITLGKLCLQQEDMAKKCVAAIARELEICQDFEVRNNCVLILCDLCVRYSTLVDQYITSISSCLKDECPLIRKQTLTLFTDLLQEDYLKWKGSLFYRFITALVDDVKEIRDFAEFCLVHLLMQRHPGMFYQHFVECIFHFNSYDQHQVYNKFHQTGREKKMFSLQGQQNFEKRQQIYHFLLTHMSDEHKFQLSAKLCQDVLASVVDDVIPFDVETSALLQDTLVILASKEIKLSSLKSKPQEDVETEQEMAQAVMNAAKKTLISQVMKRNVIENIVPTVISLKHMLEKRRTPVMKNLMMYLCELMKDYKNEVKEILAIDKQLAKEIEFDLRKFEEDQQREEDMKMEQQRRKSLTQANNKMPTGSPRQQGGSPRVLRSPGLAQMQSPKQNGQNSGSPRQVGPNVGSPGPAVPISGPNKQMTPVSQRIGSPSRVQATPGRNTSLVAQAIMNSCRKAMEQSRQIREQQNTAASKTGTPSRSNKSPQIPKTTKKVAFSESTDGRDEENTPVSTDQPATANPDFKTPERSVRRRPAAFAHTRAISTPTGNVSMMADFTFQQDDINLSVIPFSPVTQSGNTESNLLALNSNREDSQKSNAVEGRDIIHLMSPDKPAPRPRVWNIKSPANIARKENVDPIPDSDVTLTSERNTRKKKNSERNSSKEMEGIQSARESTNLSTTQTRRQTRRSLQIQGQNGAVGESGTEGIVGKKGRGEKTQGSTERSTRRSLRNK